MICNRPAVLVITMSTAKQFAWLDGISMVAMCLAALALLPAHQAAIYCNRAVAISESAGEICRASDSAPALA
jgi:hypothetical protein